MSISRHLTLEQSLQQLVLSFHPTRQFREKATQCVHRLRGREESNHADKSVPLAARPKGRVDPDIPVPRLVDRFHRADAGLIFRNSCRPEKGFPGHSEVTLSIIRGDATLVSECNPGQLPRQIMPDYGKPGVNRHGCVPT
jgi:hypothetical protein